MKMKKNALKKLEAALPKGSAEVLRKRLTIKGRPF